MTFARAELEMKWVALWEELFAMIAAEPSAVIVDENWNVISLEEAQGLLQRAVYAGLSPRLDSTWSRGRRAVRIAVET